MVKVPLIFEIYREWHMVDRVVRQFDFVQHIPENVHYSDEHYKIKKSHKIDRHTRQMFVHTENTWNERYQHVVQINHQANPIDYFNWYLRHSRKFIANAEHVVQHGYQSIVGRYEALTMGHER
ncbi:hypothetical protein H5410_062951 [Solanum commersonii]|uniref:Uncharacterized protein n=1 Tax=Solanum commersonii TaxID=4109 RepID=A0A9J5WC11_SOLCO|nr:hypothetical protein H5410_062951 [Solanum commersonii]